MLLSVEEFAALERLARAEGTSMAAWVRRAIRSAPESILRGATGWCGNCGKDHLGACGKENGDAPIPASQE